MGTYFRVLGHKSSLHVHSHMTANEQAPALSHLWISWQRHPLRPFKSKQNILGVTGAITDDSRARMNVSSSRRSSHSFKAISSVPSKDARAVVEVQTFTLSCFYTDTAPKGTCLTSVLMVVKGFYKAVFICKCSKMGLAGSHSISDITM